MSLQSPQIRPTLTSGGLLKKLDPMGLRIMWTCVSIHIVVSEWPHVEPIQATLDVLVEISHANSENLHFIFHFVQDTTCDGT